VGAYVRVFNTPQTRTGGLLLVSHHPSWFTFPEKLIKKGPEPDLDSRPFR
jgi:hypothetical protein